LLALGGKAKKRKEYETGKKESGERKSQKSKKAEGGGRTTDFFGPRQYPKREKSEVVERGEELGIDGQISVPEGLRIETSTA